MSKVAVSLRRDEPLSFRQQDKMQAFQPQRGLTTQPGVAVTTAHPRKVCHAISTPTGFHNSLWRYLIKIMMSVLWNPIGVLDIPCYGTWGAPQGGDPRLCCITRTGLNRRIPCVGFFMVRPAAKVLSLCAFAGKTQCRPLCGNAWQKSTGQMDANGALQGSSRRSETATLADPGVTFDECAFRWA